MLQSLWRQRVLVAGALVLSCVGFLLATYRVGFVTLERRAFAAGLARTEVLVDGVRSRAVDLNVGGDDFRQLSRRATLIADVSMTPDVRARIARRIGVAPDRIVPDPPLNAVRVTGASVGTSDRRAYVLRAEVPSLDGGANPIIVITARAPSPAAAARLADATVAELRGHLAVRARTQGTPYARRLMLMPLSAARGELVRRGRPATLNAALALLGFLVACGMIVAASAVAARWQRAPDPVTS